MKITYAWIDDPTLRGELKPAQLCVEVDSQPDVTIEPRTFNDGWTAGKYGPFVKYSQHDPGAMFPSPVSAGDFNVRFRGRFPVIVDITLFIGDDDKKGLTGYSLPLTRARQLVRKWDADWRLLISDRAAEGGNLVWMPVQTNPKCRFFYRTHKNTCGAEPTRSIRVENVELALCAVHVKEHNDRMAAKRAAKAS